MEMAEILCFWQRKIKRLGTVCLQTDGTDTVILSGSKNNRFVQGDVWRSQFSVKNRCAQS